MDPKIILHTQSLCIGYANKPVGADINLRLALGQIVCLLGPNGSGKSTLFKSLLGLVPLLGGRVLIQQRDLRLWSRAELARTIAYVPQVAEGLFAFTVVEMVLMGRSAYIGRFGSPSAQDKDLAHAALARLGIEALAARVYTQLSGGEQQLVLLARALVQEPKVLILDEPTASLDFGNQIRVLKQIKALKQQGLAIFLCTHQPEHARRVADQVVLFKKGKIMAQGVTETSLSVAALAELYELNPTVVQQHLENTIF